MVVLLKTMSLIKTAAIEAVLSLRNRINRASDAKWERLELSKEIRASEAEYRAWADRTKGLTFPMVDAVEREAGFAIDRDWLDELALHTQITKKKSQLAYPHGRLLYSLLRRYIEDSGERFIVVFETGTARGFSALCMSKAISDAGVDGRIITFDILSHLKLMYWNCIDDHEGKKTRAELLAPWAELTQRILFMQGDSIRLLKRTGEPRINFAFLDAQHTRDNVLGEYEAIADRQLPGDMLFFDDVTPANFPGVVAAVKEIEMGGAYKMRRLQLSEERSYAWGSRK